MNPGNINVYDRKDLILRYIRNRKNEPCTQADIINYMLEKKLSSLVTTHKIIKELRASKIIIAVPDEKNRQTQRLSINDKNPYNMRIEEIYKISKVVSDFTKDIDEAEEILDINVANGRYNLNYVNWVQHDLFHKIAAIATSIELYVKSKEDQNDLYLRLSKVMRDFYELNKKTLSPIMKIMEEAAKKGKFEAGSKETKLISSLMTRQSTLSTIPTPIY